jgi:elongation factor Ts
VLIELNCESDFVARTDDFQELLRDIAMHIAATDPRFVGRDEVTPADLDREKEVFRAQPADEGQARGQQSSSKMLEGKIAKFYEEFCLLEQPFIKEASQTIISSSSPARSPSSARTSAVRRFARFKVGAADWTVAQTKQATAISDIHYHSR